MAKIYTGNIVKCHHCGKNISYSSSDIYTREQGYGVGTYYGETYMAKFIKCPNCGNELEVY